MKNKTITSVFIKECWTIIKIHICCVLYAMCVCLDNHRLSFSVLHSAIEKISHWIKKVALFDFGNDVISPLIPSDGWCRACEEDAAGRSAGQQGRSVAVPPAVGVQGADRGADPTQADGIQSPWCNASKHALPGAHRAQPLRRGVCELEEPVMLCVSQALVAGASLWCLTVFSSDALLCLGGQWVGQCGQGGGSSAQLQENRPTSPGQHSHES